MDIGMFQQLEGILIPSPSLRRGVFAAPAPLIAQIDYLYMQSYTQCVSTLATGYMCYNASKADGVGLDIDLSNRKVVVCFSRTLFVLPPSGCETGPHDRIPFYA
jgi:hypothetical protein